MKKKEKRTDSAFVLYALKTGHAFLVHSPGMRIIKTGIAVFLCIMIDYFRGGDNYVDAAVAAVVCMQTDVRHTWKSAMDRVMGTLLAGLWAMVFVYLTLVQMQMELYSIPYMILITLGTILLMQALVLLKLPGGVAISAIVFLLVTLTASGLGAPMTYTFDRVIRTVYGVGLAVFVNWLPLLNTIGDKYDRGREKAYVDMDLVEERLREIEEEKRRKE